MAQYLLGDGEHLIGRDINCPVYLDSEHISSNHAKMHLSAEGIYIEDLNSTSGTFLDGVTVRGKLRIKPGQVLQVGDLTVDLQPDSTGRKIYALDGQTGVKKWEFETGGEAWSSPAIGPNGTLYVGFNDNKFYAIKTDSKELAKSLWPILGQNSQRTGRAPKK